MAAVDPRVLLTGFAHGDLLSELYQHAALFVQPSLVEGLPLTLLEAASHGTPVVASSIPPHLQVLGEDGGPGRRLFAANDVGSLTTALVGALGALPRERAAAASLRTQVLSTYRWEQAAEELEQLYLELSGVSPQRWRQPGDAMTGPHRRLGP